MLPPDYEVYLAELGFADLGDSEGDSEPAPGGDAKMDENDSWGGAYYGSGSASFDVLLDAWTWVKGTTSGNRPTYEEVCQRIGVKGQYDAGVAKYAPEQLHVKRIPSDDKGQVQMTFKMAEDGELRYRSGSAEGSFIGS